MLRNTRATSLGLLWARYRVGEGRVTLTWPWAVLVARLLGPIGLVLVCIAFASEGHASRNAHVPMLVAGMLLLPIGLSSLFVMPWRRPRVTCTAAGIQWGMRRLPIAGIRDVRLVHSTISVNVGRPGSSLPPRLFYRWELTVRLADYETLSTKVAEVSMSRRHAVHEIADLELAMRAVLGLRPDPVVMLPP